jgi:hypothetical protein
VLGDTGIVKVETKGSVDPSHNDVTRASFWVTWLNGLLGLYMSTDCKNTTIPQKLPPIHYVSLSIRMSSALHKSIGGTDPSDDPHDCAIQ